MVYSSKVNFSVAAASRLVVSVCCFQHLICHKTLFFIQESRNSSFPELLFAVIASFKDQKKAPRK